MASVGSIFWQELKTQILLLHMAKFYVSSGKEDVEIFGITDATLQAALLTEPAKSGHEAAIVYIYTFFQARRSFNYIPMPDGLLWRASLLCPCF